MKRIPAHVVMATALFALTGCGLFGGSQVDLITEAGSRTTEAGTARVAVTTIIDAGFGQPKQRTDATGLIDFNENLTQLEMRVGIPQLAGASSSATGVPMLVIGDGESMYMRSTASTPDQPWARVPVEAEGEEQEGLGAANDLGSQLRLLGGGITEIDQIGTDDVRGEESDHYRLTISLPQAIEAASENERTALEQLAEQNRNDDFPMEVWIGDGHVRRMSYSIELAPPEDAGEDVPTEATVSTVIEYFDFGVDFDVQTPTNTVDVEQLPADGEAAADPGSGSEEDPLELQTEAPPAEGEAPPAEGEAPPAEGEAPPAEGEAPPAEGEG